MSLQNEVSKSEDVHSNKTNLISCDEVIIISNRLCILLDECDELINRKLVVIQILSECLLGISN